MISPIQINTRERRNKRDNLSSVFHTSNFDCTNLSACPGSRIVGNAGSSNGGQGIVAQCPGVILQNMANQSAHGDIIADCGCNTRSDNNLLPRKVVGSVERNTVIGR